MDAKDAFNPAVNLAWGDVAVDNQENPQMIPIHLKKSKCNQFGGGSDNIVGRTGSSFCPVAAVLSFIAFRGDGLGPFFIDSDESLYKKPVRIRDPQHPQHGGSATAPLCWPQLSDRCCHLCSPGRSWRSHDPAPWPLVQCSLFTVYTHAQGATGLTFLSVSILRYTTSTISRQSPLPAGMTAMLPGSTWSYRHAPVWMLKHTHCSF